MKLLTVLMIIFVSIFYAGYNTLIPKEQRDLIEVHKCFEDAANTRFIVTHKLKHGFRYDSVGKYGKCLSPQYSPYETINPMFEIDCISELVGLKHCED